MASLGRRRIEVAPARLHSLPAAMTPYLPTPDLNPCQAGLAKAQADV